ncbi:MAG: hypothetical protein AAF743_06680 [Planctomycetota bacterium]
MNELNVIRPSVELTGRPIGVDVQSRLTATTLGIGIDPATGRVDIRPPALEATLSARLLGSDVTLTRTADLDSAILRGVELAASAEPGDVKSMVKHLLGLDEPFLAADKLATADGRTAYQLRTPVLDLDVRPTNPGGNRLLDAATSATSFVGKTLTSVQHAVVDTAVDVAQAAGKLAVDAAFHTGQALGDAADFITGDWRPDLAAALDKAQPLPVGTSMDRTLAFTQTTLRPAAAIAAQMAHATYDNGATLPPDTFPLIPGGVELDNGFSADVHLARIDGQLTVVAAFRGTDNDRGFFQGMRDWSDNLGHGAGFLGIPGQYDAARDLVAGLKEKYPGFPMITTGHSLGGGLAAYAAKAHGLTAFTFNAAGPQWTTDRALADLPDNAPPAHIIQINRVNDPLTSGVGGAVAGRPHDGEVFHLGGKVDNAHSIATIAADLQRADVPLRSVAWVR